MLLAIQTGCAILGIRHPHKAQTTDGQGSPFDVVLGARTWADVARMVLFCTPDPERKEDPQQCGIVFPRGNLAVSHPGLRYHIDSLSMKLDDGDTDTIPFFVLEDDPEVEISLGEALGDAPDPKVSTRTVAKSLLTEWLSKGASPIKRPTLVAKAAAHQISENTLYRAAKDIGVLMEKDGWSRP